MSVAVHARRWSVLGAILLALVRVPSANAGGRLFLTWDDCAHDNAGTHDEVNGCLSNEGSLSLFCAFTLDQPVDDVLGIHVSLGLQHSSDPFPPWWQLEGPGACRVGDLLASGDFSAFEACADPWQKLGGGIAVFRSGEAGQQSSQARIEGTFAVRSDSARTLEAGVMYYGLALVLKNDRSVFPGECAGCGEPACLVLNNITLLRSLDASPPEISIDIPGAPGDDRATWRGGGGANCGAVPVRATTWGRVKSFYR